jgi:hypothetical protein
VPAALGHQKEGRRSGAVVSSRHSRCALLLFTNRLSLFTRSCGPAAALARAAAIPGGAPLHSRARRLTFSSGDLRPVRFPCFFYPSSPFYGFTPRPRSALLVFSDAEEGARPGSGRSGRRDGWPDGDDAFCSQRRVLPGAHLCPACLPACRWLLMALPVGARTTARHGPRVAHRVTRHRAVLLARGARGSRPLSR